MSGPTVLLSHDLGAGGVQRKIADLARCLTSGDVRSDAPVYVLVAEGPPEDPSERALFEAVRSSVIGVRCRPSGVPFFAFCFWCVLTLRPARIIGFLRGPGMLAVVLGRLFWWRHARIGISDDSFPSGAVVEQTRGAVHAALIRRLVHFAYSRADWVAAPSEAAKADLATSFSVPAGRLTISRNWVSLRAPGFPSRATSEAAPAAGAIPDRGFDLIYVGRLAPVKNLSLFVDVVRDLRDVHPPIRAVIVGGGAGLAELQRESARLGLGDHLVFAGWQRDVTPWLNASRLFCLTSLHEGLPIAALEAMAAGLPVISTRYPGAEELVQDGITGFLCEGRAELVDRIRRCLTQDALRARLGQQAREWVAARHGADNLRQFAELVVRG